MWRRACLAVCLAFCAAPVRAAEVRASMVVDAAGRAVVVPDRVQRVVPAGPPAAVLLAAIAPDLMVGWPGAVSEPARALLPPEAAVAKQIPRLTGRADVTGAVAALHPDLIIDYGEVSGRYADLAKAVQQKTGVPTLLLDGALDQIPSAVRGLGAILHREARADIIARFAEALLALPVPNAHPTVLYARGPTGANAAAPGTDVTAVFTRLGWKVLAPEGQGTFRPVDAKAVAALDPDWLVFSDPGMADVLAHDAAWHDLRPVRDGHAVIAPHL